VLHTLPVVGKLLFKFVYGLNDPPLSRLKSITCLSPGIALINACLGALR